MRICIDPGHGMGNRGAGVYDSGAVGNGLQEADICLAWALTLRWTLANAGIPAWMTRTDDRTEDPVGRRAGQALAHGCTHLLSIHCNSADDPAASGVEAFYHDAGDQAWAQVVANAAVHAMTPTHLRGVKSEGESQHNRLAVLAFPGPATLVEIGFISNPSEAHRMAVRMNRIAFAEAVLAGIRAL